MANNNRIKECPVCHSKNIIQKTSYFLDMISGNGSFCGECGVEFAFNSIHLKKELTHLRRIIREAKNEVAR